MNGRSLESLFTAWLARRAAGDETELEELCRAHPEHAAELRELHRQWRRVEDIQRQFGLSGSLAERLQRVHGSELNAAVELEGEESGDFAAQLLDRLSGRGLPSARYRLKDQVGRGGMGMVLRVWDEDLRRHLAMKVLLKDGVAEQQDNPPTGARRKLARFLEEAQVTGQLNHPGIVPVHEVGLDAAGQVFFTMKLVKGSTLGSVFDELAAGEGGWTKTQVLGLVVKVCEAMSYAHSKNVIHRDLKPANVMVGKFGEVYVMDWGLAKILGRDDEKDLRIHPPVLATEVIAKRSDDPDSPLYTMDGDVVGTPAYMPPEQAAGRTEDMGPASDVYALGAMLYHLLAGQMPFVPPNARVSPYAILVRVMEGPPRALQELAPDAPAELVAICERAMEREPAARYPNMQALAADLAAYVEGRVVSAYETGAWAETKKWVQRNKPLAASLVAAFLVLAAGLVTVVFLRDAALDNFELAERRREQAEASEALALANEVVAAEQARLANERADDLLRLSALQDLEDLLLDADTLWPPHPENIEGYRLWIARGARLVAELPRHRAKRAELRALALPRDEAVHALEAQEPGLAAPERRAAEGRDWSFPEEHGEARWWNTQLSKLIAGLEGLQDGVTGLLAPGAVSAEHGWSVPRRLAFAERLAASFAPGGEHATRWADSLPAIRQAYDGLELAVQMGLVPIGPDPSSGLWEFWHVATGAEPERAADGKLVLTEHMAAVLVLLPGGTSWMGAQERDPAGPNYDLLAEYDEQPVHLVSLAPFFLSKYELTQGQWEEVSARNPSGYRPPSKLAPTVLHPVEQVSWTDCDVWLERAGLALPSEAQWEYGCRAGADTAWWTGPQRESLTEPPAANLADLSAAWSGATWAAIGDWPELQDWYAVHAPIGTYAANAFGLHDVHGNLFEWCRDYYDPDFYRSSPEGDPVSAPAGDDPRVSRGGGFNDTAAHARAANRYGDAPTYADNSLGVRPARAVTD